MGEQKQQNRGKVETAAQEGVVENQSKLSTEERVEQLNDMYEQRVGKHQLVIGLDVLANEFNNDVEAARSKNPKKQKSFRTICEHEDLNGDLKGPVLRRWVNAAATMQELAAAGVNTDPLNYSHFREISKLKDAAVRKRIAEQVIGESLTFKATAALVKDEIAQAKGGDSTEESELGPVAQRVMKGLDDPASLSDDKALSSFLLDRNAVRLDLDFDEQSSIYAKAKKKRQEALTQKDESEKTLETVEQSINFLDQVLNAFRNKDAAATTSQD